MDYKKEMKKLAQNREKYFPVIGQLLDMKTDDGSHPMAIKDPDTMRIVLELIDIGYLDADAFIINKEFNEIRGLYYMGGHVLTKIGRIAYTRHNLIQKKSFLKKIIFFSVILLVCAAVIAVIRMI